MTIYEGASTLTGSLEQGDEVKYRKVFSRRENITLGLWLGLCAASGLTFIGRLIMWHVGVGFSLTFQSAALLAAIVLTIVIEVTRVLQGFTLGLFASRARDPIPMVASRQWRVAVLTTIVPGKEPTELVLDTLRAMRKIQYDNVDVWLLDEGNDPEVKVACAKIGVRQFSRKGIDRYNQPSGQFKAKTKHGNHNAWRDAHETDYDIVAQMDPDHVPGSDFVERTIGYFNDPDVAFVVAPQVYGNLRENWIARGSAFLAYVFHGIIQRGGNGMAAPLLIGTNHLYRVETFRQIGGYQDSIIEDHLTSMAIYGADNPVTGNRWKGVYTPDIVSVGEGPTSFTDFFNQQKRWAYGIWQIARGHSLKLFGGMRPMQRLSFTLLQQFYPSVAITWIASFALTMLYIFGGLTSPMPMREWVVLWILSTGSTLGLFVWLRRFNLVTHEKKTVGLIGIALMLMTIPVYVEAALSNLFGRKLTYAVTAKGDMASPDNLGTFRPHLMWAGVAMLSCLALVFGHGCWALWLWLSFDAAICLIPVVIHVVSQWRLRKLEPNASPVITDEYTLFDSRLVA